DGFVDLASTATTGEERARAFTRPAELDELVLGDDTHAAELYARARAESPESAWLEEREARLLVRAARSGSSAPLVAALTSRLERAPGSPGRAFDLAAALMERAEHAGHAERNDDLTRAASLVEGVLAADRTAAHALRSLEGIARATGSAARM